MLVCRYAAKVFVFLEQVAEGGDVTPVKFIHLFRFGVVDLVHVDRLAHCGRHNNQNTNY